jgi:hypothetical protein
MSGKSLVETVRGRAAAIESTLVETAIASTLRALGGHAHEVVVDVVDGLDVASAAQLRRGRHDPPADVATVCRELGVAGLRPGIAIELVQTVVVELARGLDGPARDRLCRHLPQDWAGLVVDRPAPARSTPRRPGGQADSIANREPHAQTKLSSAVGMSAERRGETLARGRPGGARPIAGPPDGDST